MSGFVWAERRLPGPGRVLVAVRRHAFAFNAEFVKVADLDKPSGRYVSIGYDLVNRRVAFRFHAEDEGPQSFAVCKDGGQSRGRGRMVQVASHEDWVRAVAEQRDPAARRFPPKRERDDQRGWLWVITLMPCFQSRTADPASIPSGVQGLYRLLQHGEIVYVGQGNIRSRVRDHKRDGWNFDAVDYCEVADEAGRTDWEAYWINQFQKANRERALPTYNAIGGITSRHHATAGG